MRNVKLKLFMVVLVVGWLGGFTNAYAAIINSVSSGGTSENTPPVIAPNSLNEDELCYVDSLHDYNTAWLLIKMELSISKISPILPATGWLTSNNTCFVVYNGL